jgi:hypothetical protein
MRWRRRLVPLIFVPLACGVLFGGTYYKLWTFHDIAPYIVAALIGGIPTTIAYGFKPSINAEGRTITNAATTLVQVPSLTYGRIIIRHRTENQHGGTYRDSDYLLQVVNSIPNTVARDCEAIFDLHNNTEISNFIGLWNRNNSPTISIGHPELLKLFTVSLFYVGNRRVDTKLHFYVRSNVEGALDYFDIPYGENMNRELRVLLQSTNANYPPADAFNRTIQNIIDNAVEE